MRLDEPLTRVNGVAHEHVEGAVGFGGEDAAWSEVLSGGLHPSMPIKATTGQSFSLNTLWNEWLLFRMEY
jgi:hypothetical protein